MKSLIRHMFEHRKFTTLVPEISWLYAAVFAAAAVALHGWSSSVPHGHPTASYLMVCGLLLVGQYFLIQDVVRRAYPPALRDHLRYLRVSDVEMRWLRALSALPVNVGLMTIEITVAVLIQQVMLGIVVALCSFAVSAFVLTEVKAFTRVSMVALPIAKWLEKRPGDKRVAVFCKDLVEVRWLSVLSAVALGLLAVVVAAAFRILGPYVLYLVGVLVLPVVVSELFATEGSAHNLHFLKYYRVELGQYISMKSTVALTVVTLLSAVYLVADLIQSGFSVERLLATLLVSAYLWATTYALSCVYFLSLPIRTRIVGVFDALILCINSLPLITIVLGVGLWLRRARLQHYWRYCA